MSIGLLSGLVATLEGAQPAVRKPMQRQRERPVTECLDARYRRFMCICPVDDDFEKIANPVACLKIFILFLMRVIPWDIQGEGRANGKSNCLNPVFFILPCDARQSAD
jgi:hypothetical protein